LRHIGVGLGQMRRADQVRRDDQTQTEDGGNDRPPEDKESDAAGRRKGRRDPPELARPQGRGGHAGQFRWKTKPWRDRKDRKTGEPPEQPFTPRKRSSPQRKKAAEQQRE